MTATSGGRPGSRSGCRRSASRAKGRSWCASASSTVLRVRAISSRTAGSPERLARKGIRLTKYPTTSPHSRAERPAIGAPVRNSSWPLQRESTACQAASRATKGVQPWVAASRWTASSRSGEGGSVRLPPRRVGAGRRGRSVGRSSCGVPARRSRQCSHSRSPAGLSSICSCRRAKSVYRAAGGGRVSPATSAPSSRASTAIDQKSAATWCTARARKASPPRSPRRSRIARRRGPAARSNGRKASACSRACTSASLQPVASTVANPAAARSATRCTGPSSVSANVARSMGWRSTSPWSARPRAAEASEEIGPSPSRAAPAML